MLQRIGGNAAGYDLAGGAGEKRLEEINEELTRYYKENKDMVLNNNKGQRATVQAA